MFSINKIQIIDDSILYDGDQIAFLVDHPNSMDVELSMTKEDLANGEIVASKMDEDE